MMFAVRKDGLGWRVVENESEVMDFEALAMEAPEPVTPPVMASERLWRDNEIERIRWLRERHRDEADMGMIPTLSTVQFKELLTYIQSLRDWPESKDFPNVEARPVLPDWVEAAIQ